MPFIDTKTNIELDKSKVEELKTKFGKAIEIIDGKSERWLMLDFKGGETMYFSGSDAPCAIIEVKIFGSATGLEYDNLTKELCSIVNSTLGIPETRVYVKYDEVYHWGYNGLNF